MSDAQLVALVRDGWAQRAAQGVYQVVASPRSHRQRLWIAVLAGGAGAVASHRSGASVWGVAGYLKAAPEVSLEHGRSRRASFGVVHGSLWLPTRHVTVRDGLPVTTAARTAFDLAGVVHPNRLRRDVDDLVQRGVCTIAQIRLVFFALARRGRPGSRSMRELLSDLGDDYVAPASELERRFRTLVREGGLAMPRFEVKLGDDELIGRVDALWDDAKLVIELDGRRFHGGFVARDADRERDNRLMAAGWRVLRFTWGDLRDRPNDVVRLIAVALAG